MVKKPPDLDATVRRDDTTVIITTTTTTIIFEIITNLDPVWTTTYLLT
jgi:hypothetical protein